MSGMASDDAPAQVSVEGDVSDKKVEEVQDQNEVGGMPSRQEEVLSFGITISLLSVVCICSIHIAFVSCTCIVCLLTGSLLLMCFCRRR